MKQTRARSGGPAPGGTGRALRLALLLLACLAAVCLFLLLDVARSSSAASGLDKPRLRSMLAGAGATPAPQPLAHPLFWYAPIWSGAGYGTEAANFLLSLLRSGLVRREDVWAANMGWGREQSVIDGMEPLDRADLEAAEARHAKSGADPRGAIVVCHAIPGYYHMPAHGVDSTGGDPRCPPLKTDHNWSYAIGRTMWEADRVPHDFARRVNGMDEVWVPSEWQRETFIASGVCGCKIRVVPEGVNTTHFDPERFAPLPDLPSRSQLVFGTPWANKSRRLSPESADNVKHHGDAAAAGVKGGAGNGLANSSALAGAAATTSVSQLPVRFISAFKWEERKGWDILLKAYLTEFTADDPVELFIRTRPWGMRAGEYKAEFVEWASKLSHAGKPARRKQLRRLLRTSQPARTQAAAADRGRPGGALAAPSPHAALQLPHAGSLNMHVSSRRTPQRQAADAGSEAGKGGGGSANNKAAVAAAAQFHRSILDASSPGSSAQLSPSPSSPPSPSPRTSPSTPPSVAPSPSPSGTPSPSSGTAPSPSPSTAPPPSPSAAPSPSPDKLKPSSLPTFYVIDTHLADSDLPGFYAAGNAFVLSSHGEGWGRPLVEAMSMGVPGIATNWSGITEFLDDSVGYPIPVPRLVPAWQQGQRWADPDVAALRRLMRRVVERPEEAKAKGTAARKRCIERYSPPAIGALLNRELRRIEAKLAAGAWAMGPPTRVGATSGA